VSDDSKKVSPREPTKREATAIKEAAAFYLDRPERHAVLIAPPEPGKPMRIGPEHSDDAGYILTRQKTFGSSSDDFARHNEGWLSAVVRYPGREFPNETELNAGLAAVGAVEPQSELEAMLAVQMAGTHELAMSMLTRAKSGPIDQAERYGNLATKFLRTYTTQMETLAKLRRGGEQTVRVEHVHVYQGGQAIVGQVTQVGGQHRGALENGHQAHALTGTATYALPAGAPMLRQDTGGAGMPIARGEREEAVPNARRGRRKRSAEG